MRRLGYLGVVLVLAIAGCQGVLGGTKTPAPTMPPVADERDVILVEGTVEPVRAITLRAGQVARVDDVLVEMGDVVNEEDLLLRLDAQDAALAVQQAEAALAVAEAQMAHLRSGLRPEQVALLDAQVAAATAVVSQSVASVAAETAGGYQADIEAAEAKILEAQAVHEQARQAHEETMTCYEVRSPDGSTREVCPTLGTFEEMARAEMQAAYARLEAARANLEAVEDTGWAEIGIAGTEEEVAAARLEVTLAERDKALAGVRSEAVEVAAAAVETAAVALARAEESLEAALFSAPFDAVVTDVTVDPNDTIGSGGALVTLATLDSLRVRTRNLTELDVVRVAEGQDVALRADAQPTEVFGGRVERIEPAGSEYLGDVTYSVLVVPDAVPEWLRWGMTVQVEIGVDGVPDMALESQPVSSDKALRIADAVVEPVWDEQIGVAMVGEVAEVHVKPGDQVAAGDLLLRLERDQAELAVAEAEAALASARAELALTKAGARAEEIAAAAAELEVAVAEVARAAAQRRLVAAQVGEPQVTAVQAELETVEARRRALQAHIRWAEDGGDEERADRLRDQMIAVDQQILAYQGRLAALPGATWAQLRAAEAGLRTAEAQRDAATAKLALLEAGPTESEIEVAVARVRRAEAALAAAELRLERTDVHAPSDGTVTHVRVEVGDGVAPGHPVIVVAPLDQLQVRTANLLEVDVVGVAPGQPVTVEVDALPDRPLRGHVVQVGCQHEIYRGDVTYPVLIALGEQPPELRWGMSALVKIEVP